MTVAFDSQKLIEQMIKDEQAGSHANVSVDKAMLNTAVTRCVHLISFAIGYLPFHLIDNETKAKAKDHSLFRVLHRYPNDWQTPFNFRQLMQRRVLVNGNAYALIIRSGNKVIRLVPLDPRYVTPHQNKDWSVEYHYQKPGGGKRTIKPKDMLHIYADSKDGLRGISLVRVAANAIALADHAGQAARRTFENGMMAGGALSHPKKLSNEAIDRLQADMDEKYTGPENAGKWMVLQEGLTANPFSLSSKDSQQTETRQHQVEEIGRVFGVPRPFMGLDDTSWGSGVDVLGQIFVRYALNPWFTVWEQAVARSCLSEEEIERYSPKYNAGALIRGNMKDQAEFFAKALGSGGHQPWMNYGEVRELSDLPEADIPPNPLTTNKVTIHEPSTTS